MSSDRRPASLSEAERLVIRRALEIIGSEEAVGAEGSCSSNGGSSSSISGGRGPAEATPRRRCRSERQERPAIPRNEMSTCQPGASELWMMQHHGCVD